MSGRRDLAAALADTLGLDVDEIADALDRRRISPRLARADTSLALVAGVLEREIWEDLTDGAEWPWGASWRDLVASAAAELLAADTAGAPAPIAEWARDWRGELTPDAEHRGGAVWRELLAALGVDAESDAADEVWVALEREYEAIAEVEAAS